MNFVNVWTYLAVGFLAGRLNGLDFHADKARGRRLVVIGRRRAARGLTRRVCYARFSRDDGYRSGRRHLQRRYRRRIDASATGGRRLSSRSVAVCRLIDACSAVFRWEENDVRNCNGGLVLRHIRLFPLHGIFGRSGGYLRSRVLVGNLNDSANRGK